MTIIARRRPGSRGKARNPAVLSVAPTNATIRVFGLPAEGLREMTPSGLPPGFSLESAATSNERIRRAVVFRLTDLLPRAGWMASGKTSDIGVGTEALVSATSSGKK